MPDNQPDVKKYDYLPFFYGGLSTQEINKTLENELRSNPGLGIDMQFLPYDESKKKYVEGGLIPEGDFDGIYNAAYQSYDQWSRNKFNGRVAPLWKYDAGLDQERPDQYINGNLDFSFITPQPKLGYTIQGEKKLSEEQIADGRGVFIDMQGNRQELDTGFLSNTFKVVDGLIKSAAAVWYDEDKMNTLYQRAEATDQDFFKRPTLYALTYDEDSVPIWKEVDYKEAQKGSQIRSIFGPNAMHNSFMGSFARGLYKILPSLYSMGGSMLEVGDNLTDLIFNEGVDRPSKVEDLGRILQNFAAATSAKPSEEALNEGIFKSWESFGYQFGNVTSQLLLQALSAGTLSALGFGVKAAQWGSFGVFGILGMDAMNQVGKENGIDPMDIAWMAPTVGAIEMITEGVIGPHVISTTGSQLLRRGAAKKAIKDAVDETVRKYGVKSVRDLSTEGKKAVVRGSIRNLNKLFSDLSTPVGRTAMAAREEGLEEVVAELGQNVLTFIHDARESVTNPAATPGFGLFGEIDESSWDRGFLKRLPEGIMESFVLGALGGMTAYAGKSGVDRWTMGAEQWRNQKRRQTIREVVAQGDAKKLYGILEDMYQKGQLEYNHLDSKGNVITANLMGQVESLNDVMYKTIKEEIDYYEQLRTQYGLTRPDIIERFGGDFASADKALEQLDIMTKTQEQIADMEAKSSSGETLEGTQQDDLQTLQDTYKKAQEEFNRITQPEHNNTKYSEYYNDKVKDASAKITLSQGMADAYYKNQKKNVTDDFRKTPEYLNTLGAFSLFVPDSFYNNVKTFNQGFEEYKQEQAQIEQDRTTQQEKKVSSIEKLIKEIPGLPKENINDAVRSIGLQLSEILNIGSVEGVTPQMSEEFQSIFDTALSELKELGGEELQEYETLEQQYEAGTEQEREDIVEKLDFHPARKISQDIKGMGDTVKSIVEGLTPKKRRGKTEKQLLRDYFSKSIREQVDALLVPKTGADGKVTYEVNPAALQGQNLEALQNDIESFIKIANENLMIANFDHKVLNNEFKDDPDKRQHISKNDNVLSQNQYDQIRKDLESVLMKLRAVKTDVQKASADRDIFQQKLRQMNAEFDRITLSLLMDSEIGKSFPEIRNLVNALKKLNDDVRVSDKTLTEEQIAELNDKEKQLQNINELIYKNRDKIFTPENIKRVITNVFQTRKRPRYYLQSREYTGNYRQKLRELGEHNFANSDFGYVHFVNYMTKVGAVNTKDLLAKRKKMIDLYVSGKYQFLSSYEQQQVEDLVVAFLNGGTSVLEAVIEAETAYANSVGTTKKTQDANLGLFIENTLFIRGDYGSGKSNQVLPMALELYYRINNNKPVKNVLIVGISPHIEAQLKAAVPDGFAKNLKVVTTQQFFSKKSLPKADIVLWDEASLLTKEHYNSIRSRRPKGSKMVFMGDDSQMRSMETKRSVAESQNASLKTAPLTTIYSTGSSIITNLANAWRYQAVRMKSAEEFPKAYHEADSSGNGMRGTEYFATEDDVVKAFVASNSTDKALILLNDQHFEEFLKKYQDVWDNHKSNIYILDPRVAHQTPPNHPQSMQGSRANDVYVAINLYDIDYKFPGIRDATKSAAGYTAITRARNYVGMVGYSAWEVDVGGNTASKELTAWRDAEPSLSQEEKDRILKEYTDRINRILGEQQSPQPTEKAPDTTPEDKTIRVKKGGFYRINKGDNKGKLVKVTSEPIRLDGDVVFEVQEYINRKTPVDNKMNVAQELLSSEAGYTRGEGHRPMSTSTMFGLSTNERYIKDGQAFSITMFEEVDLENGGTEIMIVTDDGRSYTKEDFNNLFKLDDSVTPTDVVEERVLFNKQAKHFMNGLTELWGTSYSVFTGFGDFIETDIKKVRAISPTIMNKLHLFDTNLVYLHKGSFLNEANEQDTFPDVLAIKLTFKSEGFKQQFLDEAGALKNTNADFKAALKEIADTDQLHDKYAFIATLGDTEYDYPTTGANSKKYLIRDEGLDYVNDFDKIWDLIESGFRTDIVSKKEIESRDGNITANQTKALIKHFGRKRNIETGNNEIDLGRMTNGVSEVYQGLVKYSFKKKPNETPEAFNERIKNGEQAGEFISRMESEVNQGIQFSEGYKQDYYVPGNKQTVAIIRHFAFGRKPTKQDPYVVFRTQRLGHLEDTEGSLRAWKKYDMDLLKTMSDDPTVEEFVGTVLKTNLHNMIANNQSIIKNNTILKSFFGKYVVFVNKHVRFDGRNFNEKVKAFEALWNAIQNTKNKSSVEAKQVMKDQMFAPIPINLTTRKVEGPRNVSQLYTDADTIHYPYGFFDIREIYDRLKATTSEKTGTETEKKTAVKKTKESNKVRNIRSTKKGHEKPPPADRSQVVYAARAEVEKLFRHIFGEDFLLNKTDFESNLTRSGIEYFGWMDSGRIAMELSDKGIEITTPRHEIFHVVYNYLLTNSARQRLNNEAKNLIAPNNPGSVSDEFAEEWLARKYGDKGITLSSEKPWYMRNAVLKKFKKFLDKIFDRFYPRRSYIDRLMRRIDTGYFRNDINTIHFPSYGQVFRGNPKMQDNAPDSPYSDYIDLVNLFGRARYLDGVRKQISYWLNEKTVYSNNDLGGEVMPELAIPLLEDELVDPEKAEMLGEIETRKGKIKDLTGNDVDSISGENRINYEDYHLAKDPKVYRTIVQNIFPGYNFRTGTFRKYEGDTITYDHAQVNPDQMRMDYLKHQLDITPLRKFENGELIKDEAGNIVPWNPQEDGFVNPGNLLRSMKEAAIRAKDIVQASNNERNLVSVFYEELINDAKAIRMNNNKADNIMSFVHRFYKSQDPDFLSLTEIMNRSLRNTTSTTLTSKGIEMSKLLNEVVNTVTSLRHRNQSSMKVQIGRDGNTYKLVKESNNTYESIKNDIQEGILYSTMDGTGMINQRIMEGLHGDNQQFDVTRRGVKYVKGFKSPDEKGVMDFIKVAPDGTISFAENVEEQHIKDMAAFLGLGNLRRATIMSMFNGTSKGAFDILADRLNLNTRLASDADAKEFTSGILAQGLMNMFWSLEANSKVARRLNEIDALATKNKISAEEAKKRSAAAWKASDVAFYKEKIDAFLNQFQIREAALDGQMEATASEDVEVTSDDVITKPVDFYNFFNVLGLVEAYVRGDDISDMSRRPDNSLQYNFVLSSSMFDRLANGSLSERQRLQALIGTHEDFSNSPFYDELDYFNDLLDPNSTMQINRLWDYAGISAHKGTTKPNTYDLHNMAFHAWLHDLKRKPKVEILNFITTNIADSDQIVLAEFTFDSTGKERLLHLELNKDRSVKKAVVNEVMISRLIMNVYHGYNRRFKISATNWSNFLKDSGLLDPNSPVNFGSFGARLTPDNITKQLVDGFGTLYKNAKKDATQKEYYMDIISDLRRNKLLREGADYILKYDDNGLPIIAAGKSLAFNDEVYNYKNYQKLKKAESTDPLAFIELKDEIFSSRYKKFAGLMRKIGYKPTDDLKLDKKNPYYSTDKNGDITEMAPVFKAYFYGYQIAMDNMMPLVLGHNNDFKDYREKSKRTKPIVTGGNTIDTQSPYGLSRFAHVAQIEDILKNYDLAQNHKTADGMSWGNPLFYKFLDVSGGGQYGAMEDGMKKSLFSDLDLLTGKPHQHKEAVDYITGDLYRNSVFHRQLFKAMLQQTDRLAKEYDPNYDVSVFDQFVEIAGLTGSQVPDMDFDLVMTKLHKWIVEESGFSDAIRNSLLWKVQNASASKYGNSGVNNWNPETDEIPEDLVTHQLDISRYKTVLNPHQDIYDINKLTQMNQIISYLGYGSANNRRRSNEVNTILSKIYDIGRDNVNKRIAGMPVDSNANTREEMFFSQLKEFMRRIGLKQLESMGFVGNYAELIADRNINIDLPMIRARLVPVYRNMITREAVKVFFTGLRMNQSSGEFFNMFEKDGVSYMLEEVERDLGKTVTQEMITSGKVGDYTVTKLKGMQKGKDNTSRMQVLMPFSYAQKFGIKKGETLNDVFTLHFVDQSKAPINVRNKTTEQIQEIINNELEGKDPTQVFDLQRTVMLRESAKQNKEWYNYLNAFRKSLQVYTTRVPSNRLGSGAYAEVVGFIQDNANTIYIPIDMTIMNDSDFDIDQLSVFLRAFDNDMNVVTDQNSIKGLQNRILDILDEVYSDPDNQSDLFIRSNIDNLQELADKSSEQWQYTDDNAYTTTLKMHELNASGAKAIGVLANETSALGYLTQLGENISEIAPGFANVWNNMERGEGSVLIRVGDYLQSALDNAKNLILGSLNISHHATNVVGVMVMDGKTDEQIQKFFADDVIISVYEEVGKGDSVEESSFSHRPQYIVRDMIEKVSNRIRVAKSKETGRKVGLAEDVLKQDYDEYVARLKEMEEELKDQRTNYLYQAREPKALELYEKDLKEYNAMKKRVDDLNALRTLNELAGYINSAEALRRLGVFMGMRNGLEAMDADMERFNDNASLYNGFDIGVLAHKDRPLVYDLNKHLDYFVKNNNQYIREKSNTSPNGDTMRSWLLQVESEIAEAIHIPEVIDAIPWMRSYLYEHALDRVINKKLWLINNEVFDSYKKIYLQDQLLANWDFDSRRAGFYDGINHYINDHFFKDQYTGVEFNLAVPQYNNLSNLYYIDDYYKNVSISNVDSRVLFMKQFPNYVMFLKNIADNDNTVDAIQQLLAQKGIYTPTAEENQQALEEFNILRTNDFIQRMLVTGFVGSESVTIADNFSFTPERILELTQEFEQLPDDIKQKFRLYQLMIYGFRYKKGSMGDVLGKDVYLEVSKSMEKLKSDLNSNNAAIKEDLTIKGQRFVKWLAHQRGMSQFLSQERAKKGERPGTILARKKIREGLYIVVNKRYNPYHTDHAGVSDVDNNGYYIEYLMVDRHGNNFDSNQDLTTSLEAVRNFTADDYITLDNEKKLKKTYFRGHGYRFNERTEIIQDGEVFTQIADKYYVANGRILKLDYQENLNDAVFRLLEKSLETYSKEQIEQTLKNREKHEQELDKTLRKRNAGLKKVISNAENNNLVNFMRMVRKHNIATGGTALPKYIVEGKFMESIAKELGVEAFEITAWWEDTGETRTEYVFIGDEAIEVKVPVDVEEVTPEMIKKKLGKHYSDINKKNVLASDGTVIFGDKSHPTSKSVLNWANRLNKPVIIMPTAAQLRMFIAINNIQTLNIMMPSQQWEDLSESDPNIIFEKGVTEEFMPESYETDNNTEVVEKKKNSRKDFSTVKWQEEMGKKVNQDAFRSIVSVLETAFPGLTFIEETDETTMKALEERPDNKIPIAWVDESGVHFNMDRVTSTTFIHELAHIWNKVMYVTNRNLWEAMARDAQDMIDRKDPVAMKIMADTNLEGDFLRDEVMATIAGFASRELVEGWLLSNNVKQAGESRSFIDSVWDRAKKFVNRINNFFQRLFENNFIDAGDLDITYGRTRLAHIYSAFTGQVLKGRPILNFNSQDVQNVFNAYYVNGNKISQSSYAEIFAKDAQNLNDQKRSIPFKDFLMDFTSVKPITVIKDIHNILNNNGLDSIDTAMEKEDRLVEWIFNSMRANTDTQGGKSYYTHRVGNKFFRYDANLDMDTFRRKIRNEIAPVYYSQEYNFKPKLKKMIDLIKAGKDTEAAIVEAFGRDSYTQAAIEELMAQMGVGDTFLRVMEYEDMARDDQLKKFYDPDFTGFNPMVVVHGIVDDVVDLSIIDVTPRPIMETGADVQGSGMMSAYESDRKYNLKIEKLGADGMTNKDGDIRRLLITMAVMKMKSAGNIRIRNIGVAQLTKTSVNKKMIPDINLTLKNIKLLSENDIFMGMLQNDKIKQVLTNEELYNSDYNQSFIHRARMFLKEYESNKDFNQVATKVNKALMDPNLTKSQMIRAFRVMQKYLTRRFGLEPAKDRFDYQVLSRAIMEAKTGNIGYINTVTDMHSMGKYMLNAHNAESDILQVVWEEMGVAKNEIIERMRAYQTDVKPLSKSIIQAHFNMSTSGVGQAFTSRMHDIGSHYFRGLYIKQKTVAHKDDPVHNIKKGDVIEYYLPMVHHDVNSDITKQALAARTVTLDQIKYYNKLYDHWKEQWAKNIYWNNILRGNSDLIDDSKFTMDRAYKEFEQLFPRGSVPVMTQSVNEMLTKLTRTGVKAGAKKLEQQYANWENLFEDKIGDISRLDEVSAVFYAQLNEPNRLADMGLALINGQYRVVDYGKNQYTSTNLENISNYFMLSGLRKEVYERRVVPAYNDANAAFNMLESAGITQTHNRRWLEEYYKRNVHRKTSDPVNDYITTPWGVKVNKAAFFRGALHLNSFVALGFKPIIALKSLGFNTVRLITEPLAASIANWGVEEGADSVNQLPGVKEVTTANKLFFSDFKKMRALGYMFQIVDRTERDVLESIFINPTKRNLLTEQVAHMGNWGTDAWARLIGMTAVMLKHGSWDAYTYNPKTGEISYDETKDDQFYKDQGGKRVQKTERGEHAVKDALRDRLIDQGVMSPDDTKLARGYDYTLATGLLKWYGDKFIIGSMDDQSKAIAGQTYVGQALSQFRMFAFDRLWNAGLFAHKRKTRAGAGYKAVKDENGDWISVKEVIEIEGMWQSVMSSFRMLSNLKNESAAEWWRNQTPMRRMNIAKAGIQVAMLSLIYFLIRGIGKEREEKYGKDSAGDFRRRFNWLYSDIFVVLGIEGFFQIPILQSVLDLFNVSIGKKNVDTLMRYTGPVRGAQDVVKLSEFIAGSEN